MVGDYYDGNPYNIDKATLKQAQKDSILQWLGWSNDIKEILKDADIFVLPSYREGVPRAAIEAASMGKPIITTKAVGCKEVVEDNINGFLVPIKNIKLLTEKLDILIADKNLREKMGAASRKMAEKKFNVGQVVQEYLELYKC